MTPLKVYFSLQFTINYIEVNININHNIWYNNVYGSQVPKLFC